jgi:hypothetical protein
VERFAATTKERLLRTAERLFALRGIDAVSMRSICAEAGQRNNTALQYHFGDKQNLVGPSSPSAWAPSTLFAGRCWSGSGESAA